MATTAVTIPYADASPAELREAILPEERDQFDESFRRALDAAAQTLRLDELESFLEHWRRMARCQNHNGHDHWRGVLAKADYILEHGHPPPGTVTYSAEQMRHQIAERLAAGR